MGQGKTPWKGIVLASAVAQQTVGNTQREEADGQALVKKLVEDADILLENFRPGTMERWGLSYEDLSAINPKLIMIRVSGFGQTGPYAKRAGYGAIGEAMGGLRYTTGDPSLPPSRAGSRSAIRWLRCMPVLAR